MNSNDHNPPFWPDENISDSPSYATREKVVPSIIVILFFVFLFITSFHLYARWYLLRARRHRRNRNRLVAMVLFAADPSPASVGLDPAVIKSLPIFTFSDVIHKDLIDCAVCLSEFEEGESGRVLPGCKHTFHVECIDMWFHSHSTCPLCRSLVEAPVEEQVVITISPEPASKTEPGLNSGSESSAKPTEDLEIKPTAIDVPRRNYNEFVDDLTQNSPVNRMLSSTRMLSRDRKSDSSPIEEAQLQSPSSSFHIQMTESDIEREGGNIK